VCSSATGQALAEQVDDAIGPHIADDLDATLGRQAGGYLITDRQGVVEPTLPYLIGAGPAVG
jgi:hypothetical protein